MHNYIWLKRVNNFIDRLYGKIAIISLIIFTILATMLYHNPLMDPTQTMAMLKNLSIVIISLININIKLTLIISIIC